MVLIGNEIKVTFIKKLFHKELIIIKPVNWNHRIRINLTDDLNIDTRLTISQDLWVINGLMSEVITMIKLIICLFAKN